MRVTHRRVDSRQITASHPFYSDSRTLRNFLVRCKLNLPDSFQLLEAHVAWRAANIPVPITDALVAELKKGKVELRGRDLAGRPMLITRSARFDPAVRDLEVATAAVVFLVEAALENAPSGEFAVLYDRTGFNRSRNWDFDLIKSVVTTLAKNYPECVRRGAQGGIEPPRALFHWSLSSLSACA